MEKDCRCMNKKLKKSFLKFFPEKTCDSLIKSCEIKNFKKGRVIYIPGDPSEEIFFVVKGLVIISRITPNGRGVILGYLGDGNFFGEEIFIDETESRWELVEAKQDTIIASIKKDIFRKIIFSDLSSLKYFLQESLKERKLLSTRFELLIHREVKVRLSAFLLELADKYGVKVKNGIKIDLVIPHHEIARNIGATRETVSSSIASFKTKGYLGNKDRKIIIMDMDFFKSII
jgi:CRP/FNR family transcriptional regulator, cyclic AMP receptor protein